LALGASGTQIMIDPEGKLLEVDSFQIGVKG